jgi:hypothetical protein
VADKNYELLKANPRHLSLQLKRIEELWSVRVGAYASAQRFSSTLPITGAMERRDEGATRNGVRVDGLVRRHWGVTHFFSGLTNR